MKPITISSAASRDLARIWDYSAAQFSLAQADRRIRDINAALEHIAAFPEAAPLRAELSDGVRAKLVAPHVVLYSVSIEAC